MMKKMKYILLLTILLAGFLCLAGTAAATEINSSVQTGTYTITTDGYYTVTDVFGGTGRIVVDSNTVATIYLDNVSLTNAVAPLQLRMGSSVTLILADGSTNTFSCTGLDLGNQTPQAGIHVPSNAVGTTSLTIKGESDDSGQLIALGGAFSAGIGGGPNQAFGNITIEGGNVTAKSQKHVFGASINQFSGNAAGIGGGGGNTGGIANSAFSSTITIFGNSTVIATSAGNGSGIGGGGSTNGAGSRGENIIIYGNANVTATSEGSGAGIGGGFSDLTTAGAGGNINIYGNAIVEAVSKVNGAGIGGGGSENSGTPGAGGNINIYENASVIATSEGSGSGVGGGGARGGAGGAGGAVTITGNASVTATGEGTGAGIGGGGSDGGTGGAAGTIWIGGDAKVEAEAVGPGTGHGAGIGGGGSNFGPMGGAGGTITINGNPIIVANAHNATGFDIGPGVRNTVSGSVGTITIDSGNVYADKVSTVKNINGTSLEMVKVTPTEIPGLLPNEKSIYNVTDSAGNYDYTATTNGASEAYLWLPIANHLVTFDADGGTPVPDVQSVPNNGFATKPTDPTRTGEDFVEWQVSGTEYEFTDPVISKLDLVAIYSPKIHTVTFYDEDGTSVLGTETVTHNTQVSPITAPVKVGFDFNEWRVGGSAYIFATPVTADVDLIANYTAVAPHTITFKDDDGTTIQAVNVNHNDVVARPATDPVKAAHDFDEWQESGVAYVFTTPVTSSFDIDATYVANAAVYTITFNSDGGTIIAPQPVAHNAPATAPTNPVKTGHTFVEWQEVVGGTPTGVQYTFTAPITANMDLIAIYTINPSGGGSGSGSGSATIVNNTNDSSDNATSVRIEVVCVDENGNELYVQSLTAIVGNSEVITAPLIEGYMLVLNEKSSQEVTIVPGENVITFTYTKIPIDVQEPDNKTRAFPWWIIIVISIAIITIYLIARKQQNKK